MMEDLKLTVKEWSIVQNQCSQCRLWNHIVGCIYESRSDDFPVENCKIFEENKKQTDKP